MTNLKTTVLATMSGVATAGNVLTTQAQTIKNIVLVHGAFADGQHTNKVLTLPFS